MGKLLIGYGNPLRCDDGVGWFLANQLYPAYQCAGVQIIAAHQLMPEMAEALSQASRVLFVDAEVGTEPGRWSVAPVPLESGQSLSSLVHHLTPGQLLALAQALYGAAPAGQILTVVGADFGYGEWFSEPVAAILTDVRQHITAFLDHP
jgi:hydrogenase maturation protease